jgi:hypothetical protein
MLSDRCPPATPGCGMTRGVLYGLPIALALWAVIAAGVAWVR